MAVILSVKLQKTKVQGWVLLALLLFVAIPKVARDLVRHGFALSEKN
jgi:hypothetical protein